MSWKKVKLGQFLKVRDNRFKPNDKAIADLKRIDKIDFSGEIFISDKPSNTDMILIKKGDLVISGINVEKGAMAVYTGEEDITATIHYSSYSFDENTTDIEFLKSFLKSIEFKNALKEQVPGGIKTEIKPKHLLPLIVEIPTDIKDQRAVVKLLQSRNTKVDAISSEVNHQLDLVKKLRQQLLQDAVQGKLVEQNKNNEPASELLKKIKAEKQKLISEKKLKKEKELPPIKPEEIPFEIPYNWSWCRLGEICDTITKGSSPNWQGVQYVDEAKGILFITSKNVDSFKIDLTKATFVEEKFNEIEPRSILKKGDLLTNIVGASIGRTALFDLDVIANINQAVCILRIEHNLINKDYLLNLMNSDLALKMMFESQFAPGRANLSMGNIASFTIPIPPLTEQIRIVQKVDELMQYCNELEESIKQSEAQNEKLLQQVLREALRKEPVEA
jgi:type I restriction enzyme S subunit